eukprot:6202273-Pleurochrysis_carterae.AAC.3
MARWLPMTYDDDSSGYQQCAHRERDKRIPAVSKPAQERWSGGERGRAAASFLLDTVVGAMRRAWLSPGRLRLGLRRAVGLSAALVSRFAGIAAASQAGVALASEGAGAKVTLGLATIVPHVVEHYAPFPVLGVLAALAVRPDVS